MAKQNTFVVLLSGPVEDFGERLDAKYPDAWYRYSDGAYLVTDGPNTVTQKVAEDLGIDADSRTSGVVFKLNGAYWGFANRALWEWLRNLKDED